MGSLCLNKSYPWTLLLHVCLTLSLRAIYYQIKAQDIKKHDHLESFY